MTSSIRHPWLQMPSLKRKTPEADSFSSFLEPTSRSLFMPGGDHESGSPTFSSNAPKRRRFDSLERGFAHLSLAGSHTPEFAVVSLTGTLPPPIVTSAPDINATSHTHWLGSVIQTNEPVQDAVQPHDIEDVPMLRVTSYEPEKDRIVVVDLDESEDEADLGSGRETNDLLFQHLRSQILGSKPAITISGIPLSRLANPPKNVPLSAASETDELSMSNAPIQFMDDAMDIE